MSDERRVSFERKLKRSTPQQEIEERGDVWHIAGQFSA
jgi:hypothetical protein